MGPGGQVITATGNLIGPRLRLASPALSGVAVDRSVYGGK